MKPTHFALIRRQAGIDHVSTIDRFAAADLLRSYLARGVWPLKEGPSTYCVNLPGRRVYLMPADVWHAQRDREARTEYRRQMRERRACPWAYALETE